jgi:D-alanyl-D-alanine endopeptidase (penicillin-binding protein 7)
MKLQFKKHFWLLGIFLFLAPFGADAAAELKIDYQAAAFTAPVSLEINSSVDDTALPWEWHPLSPVYNYSFKTGGFYDPSRPLTLKIYYAEDNHDLKQIFSYDFMAKVWRPLLTHDFPREKYVVAETDATSGRLILLSDPAVMTVGRASWYKFKNGLFAASPDFAKGTILRVHNLDNDRFVDVTVNDWGPERDKFPDRVIDLDYVAFQKIASPSAGVAAVKIEPLKTVVPAIKQVVPQITDELNITASSAVIMLEKDNQVLWGKNEKSVSPLASLTKLVAVKVFLDTRPTLNQVVSYKYQDEKYNYEYCKPWESARLKVSEGETMTLEDLLYSALVGSANNAVETLVRSSGLSRSAFIAKMNETVKNWGAVNTRFVEPTGLSPDNVSSPLDYAIITKEVFNNPLIKKISTTLRYTFKTVNTKKSHTLTNTNKLLKTNTYDLIGSKTGYLDEAGYCLMTRIKTSAGNLIAVNLGSTSKENNFLDNENLLRYGLHLLK